MKEKKRKNAHKKKGKDTGGGGEIPTYKLEERGDVFCFRGARVSDKENNKRAGEKVVR